MKASELIEILQQFPDREIVLSSDSEGNSYSPASSYATGAYVPGSPWYGEFYMEPHELTDEARKQGYDEDDVAHGDYTPCIVLWPTN